MTDQQRRALRGELRAVARALRTAWDPIGRGQMPELPADEYADYAPRVVGLLAEGATDRAVAEYLAWVERELMELGGRPAEALEPVAAELRAAAAASHARAT